MSTQVVLNLPENAFRSAMLLARGSQQSVQGVLTETVTQALTGWELWERSAATMTDQEILELCDSQMDSAQSDRFGLLLDKQQAGTLAPEERPELWTLTRIYQLGQLRKAEAQAEAVKRGMRPALDI